MYEGEIISEVEAGASTREALGLMMAGVRERREEAFDA